MAAAASFLSPLTALITRPTLAPLSTGIAALDQMCSGVPRGTMTEIYGAPSSGRTSLLQTIIRSSIAAGRYVAWIDTHDTFDPQSADFSLSQFLWVRCQGEPDHALQAADILVRAGGFALIVLDLSGSPSRITSRIPMSTWFRLRHGAEESGAALIVSAETSNTGSCSRLTLMTQKNRVMLSTKRLQGSCVNVMNPRRGQPQPVSFVTSW